MEFNIERSIEVLSATPSALRQFLGNMSAEWTGEDPRSEARNDRWSAYDVIGHLIHAEETDWIPRAKVILAQGEDITFPPFDRFGHFENSKGRSLANLLDEFERQRFESLDTLRSWKLTDAQLDLEGKHPEFGAVSLRQLLSTWVVHDLTHIRQIVTTLASKYGEAVGPWKQYLSILN